MENCCIIATMQRGKEGEPIVSRKLRDAKVKDYILPVPFSPFEVQPTPPLPTRRQALGLIATASQYVNRRNISDYSLADSEVVMALPQAEEGVLPRLAIQLTSHAATAREYVPLDRQGEVLDKIRQLFPDEYGKLLDDIRTPALQPPVLENTKRPELAWWKVADLKRSKEAFDFLETVLKHSPSGAIRIELHQHHGVQLGVDTHNWMQHEDRLLSERYLCSPIETDKGKAIKVDARLPMFVYTEQPVSEGNYFDLTFLVTENGIKIPEEVTKAIIADVDSSATRPKRSLWGGVDNEAIQRELENHWHQVTSPMLHKVGQKPARKEGILTQEFSHPVRYAIRGFGQEIFRSGYGVHDVSIRMFDANGTQPTVRTEAEVNAKLYLSDKKFEEHQRREREFHERWNNEILPSSRPWSEEGIAEAGRYLVEHSSEPLSLLNEKLRGRTRLAVIGAYIHLLNDDLLIRAVQELPIDFIAVDVHEPSEPREQLKETTVFGEVELTSGVVVEMPVDEAKKHEGFKDPMKPTHAYDSLIARARLRGLDIVYAPSVKSWKEENSAIAERVAQHMRSNPDSRGLYITSLLRALAWSGYRNKREAQKIGFMRPFVDDQSIAKAHYSDVSVRMPTYKLKTQFPDEVYTTAQFVMPRGFGVEWRNLRQAVEASGQQGRYALDDISDSPFAIQWYLYDPFHAQELGVPDEELYKMAMPMNIEWKNLLDGVIIYQ